MTTADDYPSLRHQLLVAMPRLDDPRFAHSVTYLFEHNAEGAMGVIINRPLEATLGDLYAQLDIAADARADTARPLLYGGPVQPSRGFVMYRSDAALPAWRHGIDFAGGVSLATSRDILEAMAAGNGPPGALVALGYAGWGPGQLEQEMADNAWLAAPADPDLLFDLPWEQRWQAAARRIGVDIALISPEAGHA